MHTKHAEARQAFSRHRRTKPDLNSHQSAERPFNLTIRRWKRQRNKCRFTNSREQMTTVQSNHTSVQCSINVALLAVFRFVPRVHSLSEIANDVYIVDQKIEGLITFPLRYKKSRCPKTFIETIESQTNQRRCRIGVEKTNC